MRPLWGWSGAHRRRSAAERMWSTTSYVRAVAADGEAAPDVGTTCSLSHDSWDWPTPASTSVTSWLTPSTPLKYKLSTECLTRVLIHHNMRLSTLPPTRLVRLTQHFTWGYIDCSLLWWVSVSVACMSICFFLQLLILLLLGLFSAPSAVSIIHQVSRSPNSITLSWSQPDQPNGVILDYELQYYEKVRQWSWLRLIKKIKVGQNTYLLTVSDAEPGRMELISNKESDQHCSHSRLEAWNYLRLSSSSSDCCWIWTLQWQNVLPNHDWR